MPETFTKQERSRIMAAVKSCYTKPEMLVRRLVHHLGYRFCLHRRDLPGTPDIVLPQLRKIINVHGCFWHLHTCRHGRVAPVRHADYWQQKRARNSARDRRTLRQLKRDGWRMLVIWECQVKDHDRLIKRLAAFLSESNR